ncbi:CAP domain-containing protein [Blastococcus sp. CT_GayMR16]|uniref:CAP domain-containing protein n=1 Tax=Blastococcus sp. CT_GayMR16 TaxID=2559607 RepID=UPI00142FF068|nr:CAP domain-containing protein [Blastococcus sp. CT_GayMR16]
MSPGRHRPPPWWARNPAPSAVGAGVLVVALVIGVAAAVGPRPEVDQRQPITAQPTSSRASGTKPWPTVAIPSIGASGAWDPDATTSPESSTPTVDRPTATRCSRCGERTPVTSSPTEPATTSTPDVVEHAAADPEPGVAAELLALVNRDRLAGGCGPVAPHPSLADQSQTHAQRQAADDSMYHSPGVTGFHTWGENIAAGYDTATAVHDAWMRSAGHRANILNCGFTVMGAGSADSAIGVRYWTEQFAA